MEKAKFITVPLDEETARRLEVLSAECGADDESVAAFLLHDLLKDDELAHAFEGNVPVTNTTRH